MPQLPLAQDIEDLRLCCRTGRYLDAWALMQHLSEPESWDAGLARVLASRVLDALGAASRAEALLCAKPGEQEDPDLLYARAFRVLDRKGPFEALLFLEQNFEQGSDDQLRDKRLFAHVELLRARLLAIFRDHERAFELMERASRYHPSDSWVHVERSYILSSLDRPEEALEAAREACRVGPTHRSAVQALAHALHQHNLDAEAEALLRTASTSMQSQYVDLQLHFMLMEQGRHAEALPLLDDSLRNTPLADASWLRGHHGRLADALYKAGKISEAAEHAGKVGGLYFERMHERCQDPARVAAAQRHLVPLQFVRQDHMTCAPATLCSMARHWGVSLDHDQLVSEITYNGTPDHRERLWLEAHGWHVREFRVTWDNALQLLGRSIPFAMVTREVSSAHLSAVMGCDTLMESFLIRDPAARHHIERLADWTLKTQEPSGPRGMVFVPKGREALLNDVRLDDSELFDQYHRVKCLLDEGRAEEARSVRDAMETASPGHRLSLWTARLLSYHDGDPASTLSLVRKLRELYPNDTSLRLEEATLREQLDERDCLASVRPSLWDPSHVWRDHIYHLRTRTPRLDLALRYVRWLVRRRPVDCWNLLNLGHVLWDQDRHEDAVAIYRLACMVDDKEEGAWRSLSFALVRCGRAKEARTLLEERARRHLAQSTAPGLTYLSHLENLNALTEKEQFLEEMLQARPEDAELLAFAARHHGSYGRHERALALLARAEQPMGRRSWLRLAARLQGWAGQVREALALWRELLRRDPFANDAHDEIFRLLSLVESPAEAFRWLRQCLEQYPHYLPLHRSLIQQLRNRPAEEALAAVDACLAAGFKDPWVLRERVWVLDRLGRHAEALEQAQRAEAAAPLVAEGPAALGRMHQRLRQYKEAREATLRALTLNPELLWLYGQLISTCEGPGDCADTLREQARRLQARPLCDDALLGWFDATGGNLPEAEISEIILGFKDRYPGSWQAWSVCAQHEMRHGRHQEACALLTQALDRFPMLPRLHLDLGTAYRNLGDSERSLESLRQASSLSPGWLLPVMRLADLHDLRLEYSEAERLLADKLHVEPDNGGMIARHARSLWLVGRREDALTAMENALELDPGQGDWWLWLHQHALELEQPERTLNFASSLKTRHPGDPLPCHKLAVEYQRRRCFQEALSEVDAALSLVPESLDYHDLKATLLCQAGRYQEAKAACAPAILGTPPPYTLEGRSAWIDRQISGPKLAIDSMKKVLEAHPDYCFGWDLLCTWQLELDQVDNALESLGRLEELQPGNYSVLVDKARLLAKKNQHSAAVTCLEEVLRAQPQNADVALELLDLQIHLKDWTESARVLDLLKGLLSPVVWTYQSMRVCHAKEDYPPLAELFKQLLRAPAHEEWYVSSGAQLLVNAGKAPTLRRLLRAHVLEPGINSVVGELWIRHRGRGSPGLSRLLRKSPNEALVRAAATTQVDLYGEQLKRWELAWLLARKGNWLAEQDRNWGAVSYALSRINRNRHLIHWMRDWPRRTKAEPWMFYNLVNAQLRLGQWNETLPIIDHALDLVPDHTHPAFVAWKALHCGFANELDEMESWVRVHDDSSTVFGVQAVMSLARVFLRFLRLPDAERPQALGEVRSKIAQDRRDFAPHLGDACVSRTYYLVEARICELAGKSLTAKWLRLLSFGCTPFEAPNWVLIVFPIVFYSLLFLVGPIGWALMLFYALKRNS